MSLYQEKKWRKGKTLMMDPRPVRNDMLVGVVDHRASDVELDFPNARTIAEAVAQESLGNPMLLAWFDRKAWKHSPPIC